MFEIVTQYRPTSAGAGRIVAKGHGKQKTVPINHALSTEGKHGAAVGALLDPMLTPRQRAMLRHPSARARVTREHFVTRANKAAVRWTIDV